MCGRTVRRLAFHATWLCLLPAVAASQRVQAVRVSGSAIRLDGRIDDSVWATARPAEGFTQREPQEGAPAAHPTIVRFAYDDEALWIGARMMSPTPAAIRALVSRHDRDNGSEYLLVSLDASHDRRTAYNFAVTAAGVRLDYFHRSDADSDTTYAYDPAWEAAVQRDSSGWTAELRIPFSQLRFSARTETWGVNIVRRVPAQNEWSFWKLVPRVETAWSSQMGTLEGLVDVQAGSRLELRPFVATDTRLTSTDGTDNPFVRASSNTLRAGSDFKVGIGPNFTLDATVNPDFGQIDADPAVVNLTAFETVFDERRPFFVEGAELLDARGFFYSRRIGATPPGRPTASFAETREYSSILGAAKLTGRTNSGLSLAALAAVTDREQVATFSVDSGTYGTTVVAPRTSYAVARARQEFGENGSTISGFLSLVNRDLEPGSPLSQQLTGNAISALVEGQWRWTGGRYDLTAYAGGTNVSGDSAAILLQQRSSRRYWQRPDASPSRLDPRRRALSGTLIGVRHRKVSGRPWRWDLAYEQSTPGFEANDFGAVSAVDYRRLSYELSFRESRPGRFLRTWEAGASNEFEWNFDGVLRTAHVTPFAALTLPDFTRMTLVGDWWMRATSDRLTRGGPLMGSGSRWEVQWNLDNRAGARTRWRIELETGRGELGNWNEEAEGLLAFRPGTQWEVALEPDWTNLVDPRQYVATFSGGRSETFGRRYVFATVHRHQISLGVRVNYTFTPRLSLESYAEPFASSGRYSQFGELEAPGLASLRVYGDTRGTSITRSQVGYEVTDGATRFEIPGKDFNVRSWRSNLVLRWEWRLGSTAYLVWQQDREASLAYRDVQPSDVLESLRARGSHSIALKVAYWLPLR